MKNKNKKNDIRRVLLKVPMEAIARGQAPDLSERDLKLIKREQNKGVFPISNYERYKISRHLKNTTRILRNSIKKSIESINKKVTNKGSLSDISSLALRIVSNQVITDYPDELAPENEHSIESPVTHDKFSSLVRIFASTKLLGKWSFDSSLNILNTWHDDINGLICQSCGKNLSLNINDHELEFKRYCCDNVVGRLFEDLSDPISLKRRRELLNQAKNECNKIYAVTELKAGYFVGNSVAYPIDADTFNSYRSKIYKNDNGRQATNIQTLAVISDELNLPVETFTDDSFVDKDMTNQRELDFMKVLRTNSRACSFELSLPFVLKKINNADRLSFDYFDDDSFNEDTPKYKSNFYTDSFSPKMGSDQNQQIPIQLLEKAEQFYQKIEHHNELFKMDAKSAKTYLNEYGIDTGSLVNPSKKILSRHLREQIISDYNEIKKTKINDLYPSFRIDFTNVFKIIEPESDIFTLEKEREASITLFLSAKPEENIFTTFDSNWRLLDSKIVTEKSITYRDCIDSIRTNLELLPNYKSKLNGINNPESFYLKSSWFSIILSDLAAEFLRIIEKKIEAIDLHPNNTYKDS